MFRYPCRPPIKRRPEREAIATRAPPAGPAEHVESVAGSRKTISILANRCLPSSAAAAAIRSRSAKSASADSSSFCSYSSSNSARSRPGFPAERRRLDSILSSRSSVNVVASAFEKPGIAATGAKYGMRSSFSKVCATRAHSASVARRLAGALPWAAIPGVANSAANWFSVVL